MAYIHEITYEIETPTSRDGDYASNEFWRALDLTTKPDLTQHDEEWLETSIRRLSRDSNTELIRSRLGRTAGLTEEYNQLVSQMNEINVPLGFEPIAQIERMIFSEALQRAREVFE